MTENLVCAGAQHVRDVQTINKELVEKTLRMRCLAYQHQVKSELLALTIHSLSQSKKEMQRLAEHLTDRADLLQRQQATIEQQRDELARRNRELEDIRDNLESQVETRTRALEERLTVERRIQQELRDSEARYREYAKIFETTAEGLMITDENAQILEVNPALTQLTDFTEDDVLGRKAGFLYEGDEDSPLHKQISRSIQLRGEWQGEVGMRRKCGPGFPAWLTITRVPEDKNRPAHFVGVFADISRLKESEAQLNHLAHHDTLTGLPNRLLFNDRLEHALIRARREQSVLAVMFLDLDHFKTVNDTFGHPAGDVLLRQVAGRLSDCVREDDTIARLSGDEFIIILEEVERPEGPGHVAEKLLEALKRPVELEGTEIYISASIGISLYPNDGDDVTSLVRNADVAMYKAKEQGRHTYRFYKEEMTHHAFERMTLETHLRQAIERNELKLVYQPQFDLADRRPVCLEALLRWHHPSLGVIEPERFIPIAEETGMIEAIGAWVIRRACSEIAAWSKAGIAPCPLAINLSVRQLDLGDLAATVESALKDSGLEAANIELELTETALMRRPEHHAHTLNALRKLGVRLAIDDFGTGYSSLAYLKRFPVDRLKIDHSFVQGIPEDRNDTAIIQAIIAMAHSLDLTVVAEGVEMPEQLDYLRQAGCDQAQGYLLGRPRDSAECKDLFSL